MLISASFVLLLFTTFWRCELFDGMEDQYSILIRFDTQDSTDKFYLHFNGRQYNSLEYSYRKKCARCFSQLMSSSLVTVVHSNTLSHLQQAQLNSLHVQFVLRD